jgi:phytoene dehydrogenase-like protein
MESSNTCDVLIVGGGMAGLTAAAYLSKDGKKVILCEKEKKIGGLVNSFEYKGFIFDGGIRAIENSGIVLPMLRQLGIEVDFFPSQVSIGIGKDVVRISSKDSLANYQELLDKNFPENKQDIARIIHDIRRVMDYMDILYGIDNPLFMELKKNPDYVFRRVLPWAIKYILTIPKMAKLYTPVDEYLAEFSNNLALLDIIAQHFFQKTPAFFALSYFSLYLDYRYPKGGTGTLPHSLEKYTIGKGAEIIRETEITCIYPGENLAVDSRGNTFRYKKLIWAANQKTLYKVVNPASVNNRKLVRDIEERRNLIAGKTGGDSVFTLFLTCNLDKAYFAGISSAHFFYTPSIFGLSNTRLNELSIDRNKPEKFIDDKNQIMEWLKRFVELTTFEISCPVLRDGSLAPLGKTGLIVSTLFDYSLAKHIQKMGWIDEFRNNMTDHIVNVLEISIYPGLKAALIDSFTSTPLTIEKISGNSEGAITGWAFTNDVIPAVNRLPKVVSSVLTPIPDTFQAGQWTYSPSGLPISILTGKLAADRVIKELR